MTAPRLSTATMAMARNVRLPGYDRRQVTPGIIHLGIGNFHRAHQAVYVDDGLANDPSWGIIGVSLRRPDMRDALVPQDGLYTLAVKDAGGTSARIVGSVLQVLCPGDTTEALIEQMADPSIRIVSLTVTEKGYCHDPATGNLLAASTAIRADLERPRAPRTTPGLLVAALARRRARGVAPFTVLSCDNLPNNGRTAGRIVGQMAALVDDGLSTWIEREVAFPSTMIDRIVPATTDTDRAEVTTLTGLDDAWPVMTEPFTQWVIEDRFPMGRPPLPGAELVGDVEPYEMMKLRMLNGAHSTLAYFGQLSGHETVADAMADPGLARLLAGMWREEIAPTLLLRDADPAAYAKALAARFANPALRHRTAQIAMDGSQKIPQRLLHTIRDRRRAGLPHPRLTLAVAGWLGYLAARGFAVDDPIARRFADAGKRLPDVRGYAVGMLAIAEVFGELGHDPGFVEDISAAVQAIITSGPAQAIAEAT
jgi:fructuronate reductase